MKLFKRASKQNQKDTASAPVAEKAIDANELIAVISAAIAAMGASSSGAKLQVKSIRRQGSGAPIWNIAARNENIRYE